MLTRTGLQVITDSLKLIGAVAGHEVPGPTEQADALARLNEVIDSWGLQQTLLAQRRDVVPLVAAQQTYGWGPGEDIDLPVPVTLDAVSYVVTGTVDTEVFLGLGTTQAYVGQAQKSLTGAVPQAVQYTRTHDAGELWVWPVPTGPLDLVVYWQEPLAQFPDLVTPMGLSFGYARALRTNLAWELAPEWGRVDAAALQRIEGMARESLADVKRANVSLVEIGIDPALTGAGVYNILTDE